MSEVKTSTVGAASGREHGRALRTGRYSEAGRTYLVTSVTACRKPLFNDLHNARKLVSSLKHADEAGWTRTLAFCLMPDHLHWLLELGDAKSLSELMRSIKTYSARTINASVLTGDVWQEGFHDHAVRAEEDLINLARYVVANPLRAGLVSALGEYPHWDACWLGNDSRPEAAPTLIPAP